MAQHFLSFLIMHMRMSFNLAPLYFLLWHSVCLILLTGCAARLERLGHLGEPPPLYPVVNPAERARHIEPPHISPNITARPSHNNSLWQTGSKAFLKDQRASGVGDIVKIRVKMDDQGKFENLTQMDRKASTQTGLPNMLGFENKITKLLPKGANPASLINLNNVTQYKGGQGSIERSESLRLIVPALVTQVLANGYFMIQGSQEIRLGQEVRRLMVQGILRPEDIDTGNIAPAERLTEARIFYGGEGDLTDMQRPRYGSQMIDLLSPF